MNTSNKKNLRITEWVACGPYAVAVEVDAVSYLDRPGENFLSPETVRHLEKLEDLAAAGDIESLKKAGTVYVRLEEPSGAVGTR